MLSFKQNFNIKENNRSGGFECILSTAEVELDCGCRIGVSLRWREVLFNGRVSGGNVICYRKLIACCWCPLTVYWLCGYTAEPNTHFTTVTVALNHYLFCFFILIIQVHIETFLLRCFFIGMFGCTDSNAAALICVPITGLITSTSRSQVSECSRNS